MAISELASTSVVNIVYNLDEMELITIFTIFHHLKYATSALSTNEQQDRKCTVSWLSFQQGSGGIRHIIPLKSSLSNCA